MHEKRPILPATAWLGKIGHFSPLTDSFLCGEAGARSQVGRCDRGIDGWPTHGGLDAGLRQMRTWPGTELGMPVGGGDCVQRGPPSFPTGRKR